MKQLLIITNSYDVTTDLLLSKLEGESVFRLNFDQLMYCRVRFGLGGFRLEDPTGRATSSETVVKAYWRKPFQAEGSESARTPYANAELRYVLDEIVNLLWSRQKFVLVEPRAERRTGKLLQLMRAKDFFDVPSSEFTLNLQSVATPIVVKSLSSALVEDKVLYTTRVKAEDLDIRFPWFTQDLVHAGQDITVVFVRDRVFSYSLRRDFLESSVDWRQFISPTQKWVVHKLPDRLMDAIKAYMQDLRLHYGRLDFLLDDEGRYWFCEVNPNGQFAWLDMSGTDGLLEAIAQNLSPARETHPIPNLHPLV